MSSLNNKNRIAPPLARRENISTGEEKMSNSSTKAPWHPRFGGKMKTAAAAVIVGIALLALPSEEVQAQCEVQIPCYDNLEFGDATSKADCDRILQEVLDKIEKQNKAINDAWKVAEYCDTRYGEELQMNELRHQGAMASAKLTTQEIFWECMGFGAVAGGAARGGSRWYISKIRGATVTRVSRGIRHYWRPCRPWHFHFVQNPKK